MGDMTRPASGPVLPIEAAGRGGPALGFEGIPLDLSTVPSLEQGLADAAVRYQAAESGCGRRGRRMLGVM